MKATKEEWWEYLLETDLKDLASNKEVKEAMEQIFYCGYACKEAEVDLMNVVEESLEKDFQRVLKELNQDRPGSPPPFSFDRQ